MATISGSTTVIMPDGSRHTASDLARYFGWPTTSNGVEVPSNTTIVGTDGFTRDADSEAARLALSGLTSGSRSDAGLPRMSGGNVVWDDAAGTTRVVPRSTSSPGSSPTGEDPTKTSADKNALAMLKSVLADYGFSEAEVNSLAGWAWGMITSGAGQAEVLLALRQRPEFKAKFPEIEARQKAGLAPVSPGEIVEYRRRARQMFQQFGLPSGFYDQDRDFSDFLMKDLSLSELQERVEQGWLRAAQAPAEVRAELKRFFGVDEGGLAAFFLDEDKAMPLLMRQFQTARIGGASKRSGYGDLTLTEADELAGYGVDDQQAEAGFGALAESKELFGELVGQERTEEGVSRGEQLGAAFRGDSNARRKIAQQARRRTAVFEAGGGFSASREGFGGLGSAD